jgi:hypothetical protein
VVLNQVVDRIDWLSNNNDKVVVNSSNGQKYETDCVIFTGIKSKKSSKKIDELLFSEE